MCRKTSVRRFLRRSRSGSRRSPLAIPRATTSRWARLRQRINFAMCALDRETLAKSAKVMFGASDQNLSPGRSEARASSSLQPCFQSLLRPRSDHQHEVFGPVAVVMAYDGTGASAAKWIAAGGGGLVASVYSDDKDLYTRCGPRVRCVQRSPHDRFRKDRGPSDSSGHSAPFPCPRRPWTRGRRRRTRRCPRTCILHATHRPPGGQAHPRIVFQVSELQLDPKIIVLVLLMLGATYFLRRERM